MSVKFLSDTGQQQQMSMSRQTEFRSATIRSLAVGPKKSSEIKFTIVVGGGEEVGETFLLNFSLLMCVHLTLPQRIPINMYRVTHHADSNLPLTSKQKLRFSTWASY